MSAIPKNMKEAKQRKAKLADEYLRVRGKDEKRAKAISREIFALNEWMIANK